MPAENLPSEERYKGGEGEGEQLEVEDQEEQTDTGYITNRERGYLLFLEDIRTRIGDIELANVMHLLDLVAISPSSIGFAIKQVTNYIKSKPKEGEQNNEKV